MVHRHAFGLGVLSIYAACGGGSDLPDARPVRDARVADAQLVPDGAVDASEPDASGPDASSPDAGVPDAPPDAMVVPDAAVPPDADLSPDAPPPDAAVCATDLDPADDGSGAARQALIMSELNPFDYIELYNNTASPIDLDTADYWFCSPFNYCALSDVGAGVTVPAGGYATVPWPNLLNCGTNFLDNDTGGEVILYLDSNFANNASIMDFVCWGANPHGTRKSQAEATGKWVGACDSALANGALHRVVGSDGVSAADYDTAGAASPMNCAP
jgi:hypothetical protein